MRWLRGPLALLAFVSISCAALLGVEDVTTEAAAPPPERDGSAPLEDAATEEDGAATVPEETPADEDAGEYADVANIDAAQTPSCAEPDLVARWKIDEGAGTVVKDCSGNALHGVVKNGTWTTNGADGGALVFDGNGWIGFANPPLLRLTGPFTVALWIRTDLDTTATEYVIGKTSNVGANGWRLGVIDATRQLALSTPSSTGIFNVVGGSVPLAKWRHVAAVYNPGVRTEVYMAGARVGVHSGAPSALVSTNAEARVAARFDGQYGLHGAVSDVRIYKRALTATEIAALAVR